MTETDKWLERVVHAGGHKECPPSPNIPASYIPKARQAEFIADENSSNPSPLKRKPTDAAETDSPGYLPPKYRREGSTTRPRLVLAEIGVPNMTHQPRSPRKKGNRGRDTENNSLAGMNPPDRTRPSRKTSVVAPDKTAGPPSTGSGLVSVEDVDSYPESLIDGSESKNSKRSLSPTKRMVDLRVVVKRIVEKGVTSLADIPNDVQGVYKKIQSIGMTGSGIVPSEIKDEVEEACEGTEPFLPHMFASSSLDREQLVEELKELIKIRNGTSFCFSKKVHEPSWNERVHSRILQQSVEYIQGIEYHNITTARVPRDLVPDNIYGETVKKKVVDYAITLGDPIISESDVSTRLGSSIGTLRRTINPSDYSPLCYDPIAISIETKSPDGSEQEAKVQLSIWVTAHFNRLRNLLSRDAAQRPVSVTLPILFVSGESWTLLLARDRDKSIDVIGSVLIGSTASILGCYKVVTALHHLCEWASTTYKDWFVENVLTQE